MVLHELCTALNQLGYKAGLSIITEGSQSNQNFKFGFTLDTDEALRIASDLLDPSDTDCCNLLVELFNGMMSIGVIFVRLFLLYLSFSLPIVIIWDGMFPQEQKRPIIFYIISYIFKVF
jgi:hypothetical protein